VFDTNAFNSFLDDDKATSIAMPNIITTHVQLNELKATKDPVRKERLLNAASEIITETVPTETMIFPLVFKEQQFSDGKIHRKILDALNYEANDFSNKKRKQKEKNNHKDAQIAEVALNNKHTLVTDDPELTTVLKSLGGNVINYEQFKKLHFVNKST